MTNVILRQFSDIIVFDERAFDTGKHLKGNTFDMKV